MLSGLLKCKKTSSCTSAVRSAIRLASSCSKELHIRCRNRNLVHCRSKEQHSHCRSKKTSSCTSAVRSAIRLASSCSTRLHMDRNRNLVHCRSKKQHNRYRSHMTVRRCSKMLHIHCRNRTTVRYRSSHPLELRTKLRIRYCSIRHSRPAFGRVIRNRRLEPTNPSRGRGSQLVILISSTEVS